jgi:hypothetical protein
MSKVLAASLLFVTATASAGFAQSPTPPAPSQAPLIQRDAMPTGTIRQPGQPSPDPMGVTGPNMNTEGVNPGSRDTGAPGRGDNPESRDGSGR